MITITIDNYKDKKITYTMSDEATIEKMLVRTVNTDGSNNRLTNVTLELVDFNGITEKEETNEQKENK